MVNERKKGRKIKNFKSVFIYINQKKEEKKKQLVVNERKKDRKIISLLTTLLNLVCC